MLTAGITGSLVQKGEIKLENIVSKHAQVTPTDK